MHSGAPSLSIAPPARQLLRSALAFTLQNCAPLVGGTLVLPEIASQAAEDEIVAKPSHVLRDKKGRRDGWVAKGAHFVLLWDFAKGTWGESQKVDSWPLKFRMTCIRR